MNAGSIKLFRLGLVLALVGITWLALTPSLPPLPGQSDKLGHLLAFLTLAFLADFAFPQRGFDAGKFLPLLGYGLGLELLQSILPHRFGSVADLLADAGGLALYALLLPLLRRQPLLRDRWDKNSAADSGR